MYSIRAFAVVFLALVCFCFDLPASHADQITDTYGSATAENAWAYLKLPSAGRREDVSYVPQRPQYAGVSFRGFVVTPSNGEWGGSNFISFDTDYIFRTTVVSDTDMTVPLNLEGDDGHAVYINGEFIGGGGFGASIDFDLNLAAGVPVELELALYNAEGPYSLLLIRRDNGMPLTSTPGLTITAPTVVISPPGWLFPQQLLNVASQDAVLSISNFGSDTFTIASLSFTRNDGSQFAEVGNCPGSLAAGESCVARAHFTPTSINNQSAIFAVGDSSGGVHTSTLGGTGTVVSLSPTSIDFGNQAVGTSSNPVTVTLTNTGTVSVKIYDVFLRYKQAGVDFTETSQCRPSQPVAPGGSCTISVTFSPQTAGRRVAMLYISDNGGGSQAVALVGIGI